MAKLPNFYKVHADGCNIELEPIYEDLVPVVHGRWIEKIERAECSVCHDECWAGSVLTYNYCPNCGARMAADGYISTKI